MKRFLSLILVLASWPLIAQQMDLVSYRDLDLPFIELNPSAYNFGYPILSDILDSAHFQPPDDGLYLKSGYGHRYLSTRTSKTDNHGGLDFWQDHIYMGVVYDDSNKVDIICMCDGVISEILNGPDSVMELTGEGRSVQVTCDSSFQSLGDNIKINYRHLSSLGALATIADTAQPGSVLISKGDVIGKIGESGFTTNVHLHLSTQAQHPLWGSAFVNTNRLFDPTLHPGLLAPLTDAQIRLLYDWQDSALFRVIWPLNQTINQFVFINQSDTIVFNKEEAYDTGSAIRDEHDCIPGVNVYAYQFNGKATAAARYNIEKSNMPAIYPASPQRDSNLAMYGYAHIPITHDSVSSVYDFIVKGLSANHVKEDFIVQVSDVWGYTVEGKFLSSSLESVEERLDLNYYPNPTHDHLNLEINESGIKRLKVFDLFGKLILDESYLEDEITLDLSRLAEGLYVLHISAGSKRKSIKVEKH